MILAILQARMSSNRLPGKVLRPLLGQPMLARQLERINRAKRIDKVVVATSTEPSDDAIAKTCEQLGQACFRGSLNNVLSRFYHCAEQYKPQHVVRLTADCPLIDPEVLDEVLELHLKGGFDYTTNAFPRTYPDGLDVEVMTMDALSNMHSRADQPDQLEHVTMFIRQHPQEFTIKELHCPQDLSHHRWTVDHEEDFILVEQIFKQLYETDPGFDYQQVLALLEQDPTLFNLNHHLLE